MVQRYAAQLSNITIRVMYKRRCNNTGVLALCNATLQNEKREREMKQSAEKSAQRRECVNAEAATVSHKQR